MAKSKNNREGLHTLSDDDVLAFINAWHEDFGELLTPEEARVKAQELLELFLLLARKRAEEDEKNA